MALRLPSGVKRGSRKQLKTSGRLGEHEEGVAHRRRHEPLVSMQPKVAVAGGLRARGIGAQVGAALVLGHAHADSADFFSRRNEAEVVVARKKSFGSHCLAIAGACRARHRAVGHGDRAIDAAFDLVSM